MPLELESLRNATHVLSEALNLGQTLESQGYSGPTGERNETLRTVVRSGVIKHFEFTYEMSWLFIKRWLENNVNPDAADGVTRRELFRMGAENRLINDADRWMGYHFARKRTSHTYRESAADEVYGVIPHFLADARLLLEALEARND